MTIQTLRWQTTLVTHEDPRNMSYPMCACGQESISQSNIRRKDQIMSIFTDLETSQHQLKESSWAVEQATQELTRSSRAIELEINGHFDELEGAITQRREWMLQQLVSERAAKTAKLAKQARILIIFTASCSLLMLTTSSCMLLKLTTHMRLMLATTSCRSVPNYCSAE